MFPLVSKKLDDDVEVRHEEYSEESESSTENEQTTEEVNTTPSNWDTTSTRKEKVFF